MKRRSSPAGRLPDRARGPAQPGDPERGSALVIAVLVSVILVLLGISFLLMGETENRIARNEKRMAQALYVAEAGTRAVKRWFDRPGTAVGFPPPSVVQRDLRRIVDETDPNDPAKATLADGAIGSLPYYKQGIDLDSDGVEDLFDRPYRPGSQHALMGTPDGPDLRIDEQDPGAQAWLDQLTEHLVGDFPGEPGGVYTRIDRIDIFAPPYIEVGADWSRYGLATVRVVARIYVPDPAGDRVVAESEVESVIAEVPYRGAYGPLHSGADLVFTGNAGLSVHWGALSSTGQTKLSLDPGPPLVPRVAASLPREEPAVPHVDPLWNSLSPAAFTQYRDAIDVAVGGGAIADPWLRVLAGGNLVGAPAGNLPWPTTDADADGVPEVCCDHSGLAQNVPLTACPIHDYDVWKLVATSGERDARYFVWAGGDSFRENGTGPARSFAAITNGQEGVYFFETRDRLAPIDIDGDGRYDNLTPEITVSAGGWHFRGYLYLNAARFKLDTVPATSVALRAPGEPFHDTDQDGEHDPGEGWINLAYPAVLGDPATADLSDGFGGGLVRNPRGPAIAAPVSLEGMLFTNGRFEASGSGTVYGTLIAREGVVQEAEDGSLPTPELYWDASVREGFPPEGWDLPRTVFTGWATRH